MSMSMNYCILSSYDSNDSMVNGSVLLISEEMMLCTHLPEDEVDKLKSESGCWFDMNKVKVYLRSHSLIPCQVIECSNGSSEMSFVGIY